MKKSTIICALLLASTFLNSSCKKFLEVYPKSSISDKELFTSEEGFSQAIVGVYSIITNRALYGDNLTMGFLSALASNYSTATPAFMFDNTSKLKIQTNEVLTRVNDIWKKGYNAINNLNNVLDQIDAQQAVFKNNHYALTKGEALGLRAFLHFDLVRLFGEPYNKTSTKPAIPYRTIFAPNPVPPVSVAKVMEGVLKDLEEAASLLKDTDPVQQDPQSRRFSMNYLAVKALQARAYLFIEEKTKAIEAAKIVIQSGAFRFITARELTSGASTKDRLFSPELVFALRNDKMKLWVETERPYFRYQSTSAQSALTQPDASLSALYDNIAADIRRANLFESDQAKTFPSKYWQTYILSNNATAIEKSNRRDQTLPIIRWTEMYYIIAEASATPQEGAAALNTVRVARSLEPLDLATITPAILKSEIQKEYQKEFYAEGQTFFYYKRLNITRRQFSASDANLASYILPIPDEELEFNNNYN